MDGSGTSVQERNGTTRQRIVGCGRLGADQGRAGQSVADRYGALREVGCGEMGLDVVRPVGFGMGWTVGWGKRKGRAGSGRAVGFGGIS